MTSMWMLERADGTLMDFDNLGDQIFEDLESGYASENKQEMDTYHNEFGGHLVELVPAKPKVPVSREEAELIDGVINGTDTYPASGIHDFVVDHFDDGGDWPFEEFRLMEAAINGYTVVEPTKYNVKVPHTTDGTYYTKVSAGIGTAHRAANHQETQQFTMTEIKHYGLEDCERVEINTEDSDDD